jgi:hypothetical protein
MDRVTQYWTIAEKNARLVPLEGALLWNRLLWIGVAVALLTFTYFRFKFVYAIEGRLAAAKQAAIAEADFMPAALAGVTPRAIPEFSTALSIRALARLTRLGFTETVKNIYFAVIVLAGALFMIFAARTSGDIYGTPTYPVTYQMLDLVGGSFQLFILIIITFYSGELVWRERDARTHELVDALPLPNWTLFLSKLCGDPAFQGLYTPGAVAVHQGIIRAESDRLLAPVRARDHRPGAGQQQVHGIFCDGALLSDHGVHGPARI